jgi:hypothetical protein
MSLNQRFHWTEPFAFARARARTSRSGNPFFLFVVLLLLFSLALLAVAVPDSAHDIVALIAVAVVGAFLIAFPGVWLFSRLPSSILVAKDRIAIGRTVIPMAQVQSAVVGTTKLEGIDHPVFTFRTTAGHGYLFGLGRKIDATALATFLQKLDVREPQA